MGRSESVTGIRYLPKPGQYKKPLSAQGERALKFSVYVSGSPDRMGEPVKSGTFITNRGEQEIAFEKTEGRYFKLVFHAAADDSQRAAVAEFKLLAHDVEFADSKRESELPPMAGETERFKLLHDKLKEPTASLKLDTSQLDQLREVLRIYDRVWSNRHTGTYDMEIPGIAIEETLYAAIYEAAKIQRHSPVWEANIYAVAASPKFSTEAQRRQMALNADAMRATRMDFLSAIKRILSREQQLQLKDMIEAQVHYSPENDFPEDGTGAIPLRRAK